MVNTKFEKWLIAMESEGFDAEDLSEDDFTHYGGEVPEQYRNLDQDYSDCDF